MYFDVINNIKLICIKLLKKKNTINLNILLNITDIYFYIYYFFYKNNFNNDKNINKDKVIILNKNIIILHFIFLYLIKKINIKNLKKIIKYNINFFYNTKNFKYIDIINNYLDQKIELELINKIKNNKINKKINVFKNKIWIFFDNNLLLNKYKNEYIIICGLMKINNFIIIDYINNFINENLNKYFYKNIKKKFNLMNWDVIGPIDNFNHNIIKKSIKKSMNSLYPILILFKTINFSYNIYNNINYINKKTIIYKNFFFKYLFKKKIFYDNKIKYFLYFIKNYYFLFLEFIRILNNIIINFNLLKLYLKYKNKKINKFVFNFILDGSINLINFYKNKNLINYKQNLKNINYIILSNYVSNMKKYQKIYNTCNNYAIRHNYIYIKKNKLFKNFKKIIKLNLFKNIYIFRPFNLLECILSFYIINKLKIHSSLLIISKKKIKNNFIIYNNIKNIYKGCYELMYNFKKPELTIISSGSDLEIVFNCYFYLKKYFYIKIISLYCLLLFEKQKKNYKNNIFTKKVIFFELSNNFFINKYNINYLFIYNIKKYNKLFKKTNLLKYFNITKKHLIKLCLYIIKL